MRTVIRCHTLFDITNTGIQNRRTPNTMTAEKTVEWEKDRSRQSNFDTIVQAISLRTQPEDITKPIKKSATFDVTTKYGFLFENEEDQPEWTFDFSINYYGVYNDGINELGLLHQDCDGIPIIKVGTEWDKLPDLLDVSPELRNIYFEVLSNE